MTRRLSTRSGPTGETWITQSVVLESWGLATRECTEQKSVYKPVLSTGSEAFTTYELDGR